MKLLIPHHIWLEMLCFAKQALPNEITGIGTIKTLASADGLIREFVVSEIRIAPQRTSGGYCEFLGEALHGVYLDFIEADRADEIELLRFRWHSHGEGQVFFSVTDVRDIEKNKLNTDWSVNLVMNAHGQFIAQLDQFRPFRLSMPIDVEIQYDLPHNLIDYCAQEIAKNLQEIPGRAPTFDQKIPANKSTTVAEKGDGETCQETSQTKRGSLIR